MGASPAFFLAPNARRGPVLDMDHPSQAGAPSDLTHTYMGSLTSKIEIDSRLISEINKLDFLVI